MASIQDCRAFLSALPQFAQYDALGWKRKHQYPEGGRIIRELVHEFNHTEAVLVEEDGVLSLTRWGSADEARPAWDPNAVYEGLSDTEAPGHGMHGALGGVFGSLTLGGAVGHPSLGAHPSSPDVPPDTLASMAQAGLIPLDFAGPRP